MAAIGYDFEYRRLGGFTYHLLGNPRAIRRLLLKWRMAEWEHDHAEAPDEVWSVEWMQRLPSMTFSLETMKLSAVQPREDLMQCRRPGYSFVAELESRLLEREQAVQEGCSIGPLLVDGSNMELMDGYVRYTMLKRHHEKIVYAYVGRTRSVVHHGAKRTGRAKNG